MKRFLSLLLVVVMVLTIFAGCQKATNDPGPVKSGEPAPAASGEPSAQTPKAPAGEFVRHNLGADPQTIDPALNTAVDGAIVLVNMYEGLVQVDKDNQVIPGVAEKWDISEDGLTYTFHLRDSKWSDGKPVTAKDFEYAWKRALAPETASEYAYQMYYIAGAQAYNDKSGTVEGVGVKAIDDKTLEVKLIAPTPYFLSLTAFPTYFPVREDIVSANPEKWSLDPKTHVSNGPFKLDEWAHNDVLRIVKNDEYYNAENVKLKGVEFYMIVEAPTALQSYLNGELDYDETIPQDQIPNLTKERKDFQIYPYIGTYFYCFNTTKAPFDNVNVRKAFSLAIDRKGIVEAVAQGGQKPAMGFVPYGMQLSDKREFRDAANTTYGLSETADVEGAKKALADAGFPDGQGLPPVELIYNTDEGHKAIAEAVQEMWNANLGVQVELRNEEWKVFQTTRNEGNFQVSRHGWIGDFTDPMTFLDMWYSTSGNNDAHWKNPAFDAAIDKSKTTTGAERDAAMIEAEKLMMEDHIVAPVYYYTKPALLNERVQNVVMSALGFVYYAGASIVE
ncbi:peptide ABC transporter substrate-binding protein [Guggenheimella bovis]